MIPGVTARRAQRRARSGLRVVALAAVTALAGACSEDEVGSTSAQDSSDVRSPGGPEGTVPEEIVDVMDTVARIDLYGDQVLLEEDVTRTQARELPQPWVVVCDRWTVRLDGAATAEELAARLRCVPVS